MVLPVPSIISNPENNSVLPDVAGNAEKQPQPETNSPLFETDETPINQTPPAETAGVTQDAKPGEIVDLASKHKVKNTPVSSNDKITTIADSAENEFRTSVEKAHNSAHEQHS